MTKDFSKFQKIIDMFRGEVGSKNFDATFASATESIPKTERFILKMELKRLAAPCTRLIDLRGLVEGECKFFEYETLSHFLDDIAIRVFYENIKVYGSYTFGVYEAVKNTENNFRVLYQKEQANVNVFSPAQAPLSQIKKQYPATFYQLGHSHNRQYERMNFAKEFEITLENKNKVMVKSSDISIYGCKFRLTGEVTLNVGDRVDINFIGLEGEYLFDDDHYFYEVKNSLIDGSIQSVGCQLVHSEEKYRFKNFLEDFIHKNKRRFKINIENTISALQSRNFEHFALPKVNELPIFLSKYKNKIIPRYALSTENNQFILQYWQDERAYSTLHCLINNDRITRLLSAQDKGQPLLVYSFIHYNQGKSFFYSLDDQQITDDDMFFQQYLGYAASKDSFVITQLSCVDVDVSLAYSPFTVSNTLKNNEKHLNPPLSDEVKNVLSSLPYIVVASDITPNIDNNDYQQLPFDNINIDKLKGFGHRRLSKSFAFDELGVNYKNQRQEIRFNYKTVVTIRTKKSEYTGHSLDFSISGLKMKLDDKIDLSIGDIVNLSLPQLQKITSDFDLTELPYEVVQVNEVKQTLNMRVYIKNHQHIGRAFFKLLINKNSNKLTPDEYDMHIPGLVEALRTIYASSLKTLSLMIQTSGSRYKIEAIVSGDETNELLQQMKLLSDNKNQYNLSPILSNLHIFTSLSNQLKKLLPNDKPINDVLYIAINSDENRTEGSVSTKLESELNTIEIRQFFIKKALRRGRFYCLQVKLSRTNEPVIEHLNPELSYISTYAIHRAKQIELDIWNVVGVIEIFDITQETLLRYQLFKD